VSEEDSGPVQVVSFLSGLSKLPLFASQRKTKGSRFGSLASTVRIKDVVKFPGVLVKVVLVICGG
jgi:hypothetical protein